MVAAASSWRPLPRPRKASGAVRLDRRRQRRAALRALLGEGLGEAAVGTLDDDRTGRRRRWKRAPLDAHAQVTYLRHTGVSRSLRPGHCDPNHPDDSDDHDSDATEGLDTPRGQRQHQAYDEDKQERPVSRTAASAVVDQHFPELVRRPITFLRGRWLSPGELERELVDIVPHEALVSVEDELVAHSRSVGEHKVRVQSSSRGRDGSPEARQHGSEIGQAYRVPGQEH